MPDDEIHHSLDVILGRISSEGDGAEGGNEAEEDALPAATEAVTAQEVPEDSAEVPDAAPEEKGPEDTGEVPGNETAEEGEEQPPEPSEDELCVTAGEDAAEEELSGTDELDRILGR